uniref:Pectinesterase n=1 Tax=Opuntia streptacantha TaxID=393608 RepID=A0A7C9AVP5_OPUST
MDTIKSFKGYGKVDEAEQRAFQKKVRTRIVLISISAVVLLAVIIAAVAGALIHLRNSSSSSSLSSPSSVLSPAQSLKAVCSVTLYPTTCFSSLAPLSNGTTSDPKTLFSLSLQVAMDSVSNLPSLLPKTPNDAVVAKALSDCTELFDDAMDRLRDSLSSDSLSSRRIDDLKTWLSTVLTDHETCLDGLSEINGTVAMVDELRRKMKNSTELVSNSLAIATKVVGILGNVKIPRIHRRLLGFPEWVGAAERRLLQDGTEAETPDAVVAADGSGDFKTIGEAVQAAAKKSEKRYVIYVKTGVYEENVVISKNVWNVMMYGDGMDKSVVSGNLNFVDGTPTFSTATVAVAGRGFIAKDMGFKNTAGAEKHQAVAFRSGSDRSIFYRCFFDGYQDTLYAHSNRQFYRECTITGTIDFIFGNAAVVFQKCNIQPRQPMPKQFNTITAQGKKDPNQNTGTSIQKCTISALGQVTAPTYLGRPWHQFATTVIMQSEIGPVLHPLGWIGWVNGVEPPSTIFYAEYQNTGPGADVNSRVKWAGYKPTISADEASKYTVGSLISGNDWLGDSNVAFEATL